MDMTDDMDVLLRSETRTSVLVVLLGSQPRTKSAIERQVSASRQTVSRVLTELTGKGYLWNSQAGYVLTTFGQAVTEAFLQYKEQFELADRFCPLLTTIDSSAVDSDPTLLRGAELTVADDLDPFAPLDRVLQLRRAAPSIRVVSPLVERRSVEQLIDRPSKDEQIPFEAIVPSSCTNGCSHSTDTGLRSSENTGPSLWRCSSTQVACRCCTPVSTTRMWSVRRSTTDPHAVVESTNPELREYVGERIEKYK